MKDGKDTIIVLPQFQIDGMVEIMDYIMTHPGASVERIKTKFNLNENEYHMIYDLCMPHIRHGNTAKYWIVHFKGVCCALEEAIGYAKEKKLKVVPVSRLEDILKRHGIGAGNKENKEAYDTCDLDEDIEQEDE